MSVTKKFYAVDQGADRRLELQASGQWQTFTVEGAVAGAGWTHSDFLDIYSDAITSEAWEGLLAEAQGAEKPAAEDRTRLSIDVLVPRDLVRQLWDEIGNRDPNFFFTELLRGRYAVLAAEKPAFEGGEVHPSGAMTFSPIEQVPPPTYVSECRWCHEPFEQALTAQSGPFDISLARHYCGTLCHYRAVLAEKHSTAVPERRVVASEGEIVWRCEAWLDQIYRDARLDLTNVVIGCSGMWANQERHLVIDPPFQSQLPEAFDGTYELLLVRRYPKEES